MVWEFWATFFLNTVCPLGVLGKNDGGVGGVQNVLSRKLPQMSLVFFLSPSSASSTIGISVGKEILVWTYIVTVFAQQSTVHS